MKNTEALRIKTLKLVAEETVQKIGQIEAMVFSDAGDFFNANPGISIEDLNEIKFTFEQVGKPFFTTDVLRNKIINCGFMVFIVKAVVFPAGVSASVQSLIRNVIRGGDRISVPLQGEIDICGVREDDEIEEFFDFEGISACFIVNSSMLNPLILQLSLIIKAALNVRIVVSRYKLATADVSDVEDVLDFKC